MLCEEISKEKVAVLPNLITTKVYSGRVTKILKRKHEHIYSNYLE